MSNCGSREVTLISLFIFQTHWSSAKFGILVAAHFTGCEIKYRVTQGDIPTYVT